MEKIVPTISVGSQAENKYSLHFVYIEYEAFQKLAVMLPATWIITYQKHLADVKDPSITQVQRDKRAARIDIEGVVDSSSREVMTTLRDLIKEILELPADFKWNEA